MRSRKAAEVDKIKARITQTIQSYVTARDRRAYALIPDSITSGKLYEAHILSVIVRQLVTAENLTLRLVNANYLTLKMSPGPINRAYPRIDIYRSRTRIAELWTDVEFLSLSYARSGRGQPPTRGDYHELDIMIVDPDLTGRPEHDHIWLGVECKNTDYGKNFLKEILGIRRELSLLWQPQATKFSYWPRPTVPANPPSCLLVYSTDNKVSDYSHPGQTFGIDFYHAPLQWP